jgi:hypothetical protein
MQCGEARRKNIMHGWQTTRHNAVLCRDFTSAQFNASIYPTARSNARGAVPLQAARIKS